MKTKRENKGFTLVELLTVMGVIAMLIGLLVPALNQVRKMSKKTGEKAQLHSISVALENYNGEMDGYPDSSVKYGATKYTVGAQRLAEALLGRDLLGYDPKSTWDAEADVANRDIYASQIVKGSSPVQEADSLARRKGPYLSSESVEAFDIGKLYTGTGPAINVYDNNAPVLTDIYRVKEVNIRGRTLKAGSPILYYKANTSLTLTGTNTIFPDTLAALPALGNTDVSGYIYNCMDNEDLLKLGIMMDRQNYATNKHHYDPLYSTNTGRWTFYNEITNPKIASQPRPYNYDKYLLISAGFDGIYGTEDDVTNFGN